MNITEVFMSVAEAATFLKVSVPTIYAWVHQRRVPFRHHGRRVVFSRIELEEWSKSQAVAPHSLTHSRFQVNPTAEIRRKRSECSLKTRRTVDEPNPSIQKED